MVCSTKQELRNQNKDRKTISRLTACGFSKKDAEKFIEKYGSSVAHDLVYKFAMEPYTVAKKIGSKVRTSKGLAKYFLNNDLSDESIAKAIGSSVEKVKTTKTKDKSVRVETPKTTITKKTTTKTEIAKELSDDASSAKADAFDNRVDAKSNKTTKTPVTVKPLLTVQVDNSYEVIAGEDGDVSIEDLLRAGVTQEDIQKVFEETPELAFNIGESPSNNLIIEKSKNKNNGKAKGLCGAGVQEVADSISGNPTSKALHSVTPRFALKEGIPSNAGSGYYARLENSGSYISLVMPNKACVNTTGVSDSKKYTYILNNRHTPKQKKAIDEMLDFTNQLPKGVIITWDNHVITDRNGNKKPLKARGSTGKGIQYGHVCIKTASPDDSDARKYKCDGKQENPHYTGWYGENIHICYNVDCEVPEEFAKMILAKTEERLGRPLDNKTIEKNQAKWDKTHKKSTSNKKTTSSKNKAVGKRKSR